MGGGLRVGKVGRKRGRYMRTRSLLLRAVANTQIKRVPKIKLVSKIPPTTLNPVPPPTPDAPHYALTLYAPHLVTIGSWMSPGATAPWVMKTRLRPWSSTSGREGCAGKGRSVGRCVGQ